MLQCNIMASFVCSTHYRIIRLHPTLLPSGGGNGSSLHCKVVLLFAVNDWFGAP